MSKFVSPEASPRSLALALEYLADVGCRYSGASLSVLDGQIATCGCTIVHDDRLAFSCLGILATMCIDAVARAPGKVFSAVIGELAILVPDEREIRLVENEGLRYQSVNQFLVHPAFVEETYTKQTTSVHVLCYDSTLL